MSDALQISRTAPSREFMVQQATLDALQSWYPQYGSAQAARKAETLVADDWFLGIGFRSLVTSNFQRIASRYGVAA